MNFRILSSKIQRQFYRTGLICEEVPLRNGRRHGVRRTWHKNGVLASEEPYWNDLPHGSCRQWDETGHLLGEYRMVRGTGIQRAWHDNGQLQLEVSTVHGKFCGRNRIWLRDGTLFSERFYLHGQLVSPETYRAAAAENRTLPKVRGKPSVLPPQNDTTLRLKHRLLVSGLLAKHHHCEASAWLTTSSDEHAPSLGCFESGRRAERFVQRLYHAGATKVIVPDIYSSKEGAQFADCLLVRLPKNPAERKNVRRVCAQLRKRNLGSVQPERDLGESYLYLYLA